MKKQINWFFENGNMQTLDYYNKNAESYKDNTIDVDFTDVQNRFITLLVPGGLILDFGCGAGRDTKYFLSKGFKVDAIDGSAKLCEIASRNIGMPVKQIFFSELDENERYDGIWACASILHLPLQELKSVFGKIVRAVKMGGYIYTSFKFGDFEGYRNGRYFTDFTEKSFGEFVKDYPMISIFEEWISSDVRPGRENEKWLNIILQKLDTI